MDPQKKHRLSNASFVILLIFIVWGLIGLIFWPIKVTSFWGVGLGVIAALFFIAVLYGREFGIKKGILSLLTILILIMGAALLNQFRGWPYGFLTYHDILGWKVLGVAWPIPIFWSFLTASALILMRPKTISHDPKVLFSWAFDTAFSVMILSLIVEPILTSSTAQVWSMTSYFSGVPLNSFIGWFVSSFVAAAAAILIGKLWMVEDRPKPINLFVVTIGLLLLGIMAAQRLVLVPVIGLCVIALVFLLVLLYIQYKPQTKKDGSSPAQG